jgi:hypothetical protein
MSAAALTQGAPQSQLLEVVGVSLGEEEEGGVVLDGCSRPRHSTAHQKEDSTLQDSTAQHSTT